MEDSRCCGTGTCIINEEGLCWCGQRWDGTRMCFAEPVKEASQDDGSSARSRAATDESEHGS